METRDFPFKMSAAGLWGQEKLFLLWVISHPVCDSCMRSDEVNTHACCTILGYMILQRCMLAFFLPCCESIGLLTRLNGNVAGGGNVCLYEWAALCISRWERSDVLPAVTNPTAVLSMLCEARSVNDWVLVNTEETELLPLSLALPFWMQISILEVLLIYNMFGWVAHLYKWSMHVWNPTDAEWAVAMAIRNAVFKKIPEFIGILWFPWRKPLFRVCLNYTSKTLL